MCAVRRRHLQRIVRFEETDWGGGPMLDLRAALGGDPTGSLAEAGAGEGIRTPDQLFTKQPLYP